MSSDQVLSTGPDLGSVKTICRAYADLHSDDPTDILLSPNRVQDMVKDLGLAHPQKVQPFHFFSYLEATSFGAYDQKAWRSRTFPSRGLVPVPRAPLSADGASTGAASKPQQPMAARDGDAGSGSADAAVMNSAGDAIAKNNPLLNSVEAVTAFITKYLPVTRAKLFVHSEKEVTYMQKNPDTKMEEKRKRWDTDWKATYDVLPYVVDDPIVVGREQLHAYVSYSNTKSLLVKRAVLWNWGEFERELAPVKADDKKVTANLALGPEMEISVIERGCCAQQYPTDFVVLVLYPLRVTGKELFDLTKGPNAADAKAAFDVKFGIAKPVPAPAPLAAPGAAPVAAPVYAAAETAPATDAAEVKVELQPVAAAAPVAVQAPAPAAVDPAAALLGVDLGVSAAVQHDVAPVQAPAVAPVAAAEPAPAPAVDPAAALLGGAI